MKEDIIHKVKLMGESEYTECGLKFINTGLTATQGDEVTCKKCVLVGEGDGMMWRCLICKEEVGENEPCRCMRDIKYIAKRYEEAASQSIRKVTE